MTVPVRTATIYATLFNGQIQEGKSKVNKYKNSWDTKNRQVWKDAKSKKQHIIYLPVEAQGPVST